MPTITAIGILCVYAVPGAGRVPALPSNEQGSQGLLLLLLARSDALLYGPVTILSNTWYWMHNGCLRYWVSRCGPEEDMTLTPAGTPTDQSMGGSLAQWFADVMTFQMSDMACPVEQPSSNAWHEASSRQLPGGTAWIGWAVCMMSAVMLSDMTYYSA